MGEIAEMILEGTLDYETGEWNFDGADGPGWPMTRAEALAYDTDSGWGGGRVIRPKSRPLHGFWLRVAQAVRAGFDTQEAIAAAMCQPLTNVSRAVEPMVRHGHLHRVADRLSLTKRSKRQLAAEARH